MKKIKIPLLSIKHGVHHASKWSLASKIVLMCLIPVVMYMVLFFFIPLCGIVIRALFDPQLTFKHFVRLFESRVYLEIICRTLLLAVVVTGFSIVIGYPVALYLANGHGFFAWVAWGFVLVPFWTSLLARNFAWMVLLQREGPVGSLLRYLGFGGEQLMYSFWGVVIAMTHALMPLGILCMVAVMKRIDHMLLVAAQTLSASPARAFIRVYLPLSMPGVITGAGLIFVLSLGYYITPALLGGPADVTIAMVIEQQVNVLADWGFASALSVCLVVIVWLVFIVISMWGRVDMALQWRDT